jgi:hypothetical protein
LGRNFAIKNNSDVRRGGGGKDKMEPCSPLRISCLLLCFQTTKRSELMNTLKKNYIMNKEVNGFSFAEKFGQSPIEKITKRLFEVQLFNLVYAH